ncbi:uncharacterized protein LOC127858393 isoform X2 [Dreissena polymorpha]|uniref:uncharacterized protein LOC127858393 isoform X2 n=1 Tax=Dreissena polymorpha TaxID=45954 RepID=UPI0022643779|nr:uncharacterized protein LOC127858393 isoform X2 [Dreissena polymorpha]
MEKPRLGRPPTLTQSARKRQRKASYDKKKARTIDLGNSLEAWTRLKNENKCTDSELVKMLIASHAKTTVSAKEKHSESEESSTSTHSKRRKLSTPKSKLVEQPHWSSELSDVAQASVSSGISGVQEMSDFTDMDHDSHFARVNNPDPPSSPDAGAIRDRNQTLR